MFRDYKIPIAFFILILIIIFGIKIQAQQILLIMGESSGGFPSGFGYFITSDGDTLKTSDGDYFLVRTESQFSNIQQTYPSQYHINLTVNGSGSVEPYSGFYSVVSFDSGATIILGATPDLGGDFYDWGGDLVSQQIQDTIIIDENKNIIANFDTILTQFTLNLSALGRGQATETPLGGQYREALDSFDSASTVVIQATGNSGYSLSSWRTDLVGTQSIDTIIMDSNKTIAARFKKNTPNFRVIINDNTGQEAHAEAIRTAFIQGYESEDGVWDDSIQIQYNTSIENSFKSADTNGVNLVIRSYTGMAGTINLASQYYPVGLFYPAGSNSHTQIYDSGGYLPVIIVTGAGDIANETGYDIEFYSPDVITGEPDLSSYSNGYIAGQLLFIADSFGVPLFIARQLAIEVGDALSDENGYGQVDILGAVNAYNPNTNYYSLDNYLGD